MMAEGFAYSRGRAGHGPDWAAGRTAVACPGMQKRACVPQGWAASLTPCNFFPSVCRKLLAAHPEDRGRLWEVEPPGAWGQRGNIWLKVQLQQSRRPDCESG